MSRVYNFSAGPAVLPEEVLKEAAAEMLDYNGTGMSVMEMSHRSKAFEEIITTAEQDLRDLMGIPDNYKVLFLQGGASQQFAAKAGNHPILRFRPIQKGQRSPLRQDGAKLRQIAFRVFQKRSRLHNKRVLVHLFQILLHVFHTENLFGGKAFQNRQVPHSFQPSLQRLAALFPRFLRDLLERIPLPIVEI